MWPYELGGLCLAFNRVSSFLKLPTIPSPAGCQPLLFHSLFSGMYICLQLSNSDSECSFSLFLFIFLVSFSRADLDHSSARTLVTT
jgi:hypothetical protein